MDKKILQKIDDYDKKTRNKKLKYEVIIVVDTREKKKPEFKLDDKPDANGIMFTTVLRHKTTVTPMQSMKSVGDYNIVLKVFDNKDKIWYYYLLPLVFERKGDGDLLGTFMDTTRWKHLLDDAKIAMHTGFDYILLHTHTIQDVIFEIEDLQKKKWLSRKTSTEAYYNAFLQRYIEFQYVLANLIKTTSEFHERPISSFIMSVGTPDMFAPTIRRLVKLYIINHWKRYKKLKRSNTPTDFAKYLVKDDNSRRTDNLSKWFETHLTNTTLYQKDNAPHTYTEQSNDSDNIKYKIEENEDGLKYI